MEITVLVSYFFLPGTTELQIRGGIEDNLDWCQSFK